MLWRHDGGVKCPICDGRAAVIAEKSVSNGSAMVRYLLRCSSCGYRDVLQEVSITRSGDGLKIRVTPVDRQAEGARR